MRKTYIASSAHSRALQEQLLTQNTVLLGTQVLPFEAACLHAKDAPQITEIKCYLALKDQPFEILGASFKSPSLVKRLIQFRIDLKCYGLGLDALPQTTAREKEIYTAFTLIEPHIPDLQMPKGEVYVQLAGLSHAQAYFLRDAQIIEQTAVTPTTLEAYEALNFRQELEGAVQMILEREIENGVLAIFDLANHAPYVESCFKRYGVDLELQDRGLEVVKHQCLALIHHYTKRDIPSLLDCILSGALNLHRPYKLMQYIKHFKLSHDQCLLPFDYAQKTDDTLVRDILDLQRSVTKDSELLREYLTSTLDLSLPDFMLFILNMLSETHPTKAEPLLRFIQEVYQYLNEETLPVILTQIKRLSRKPKTKTSLQVVDVNAIPERFQGPLIILGLSSKAYPNLSALSGVLDERYVLQIVGYPSLDVRNAYNLKQKRSIFHKASHLILSFPHANYEGKGLEVAYDVERLLNTHQVSPSAWPIYESLSGQTMPLKLNPLLAEKLYLKDDHIAGSVTAFESYVSDPLNHFIRYGLRIQEPPSFQLDAKLFGILNHSFFEQALKGVHTNLWTQYKPYLPQDDALLTLIQAMNQEVLNFHLNLIQSGIVQTKFKPRDFEVRLRNHPLFHGIAFNGVIDRIDSSEERLLIVDYKSSNQSLTPALVRNGLQFQLLTYAMIARQLYQIPVQGVFYYSLTRNTLDQPTKDYKKTKGIVPAKTIGMPDVIKAHQYKGWFFMPPDQQFDEVEHFSGLKKDRYETISLSRKPYDLDQTFEYFNNLLQSIREHILEGVLDTRQFDFPIDHKIDFKGDNHGTDPE